MPIGHQKPAPGANDEGTGFSDNLVAGYAGDFTNKLSLQSPYGIAAGDVPPAALDQ